MISVNPAAVRDALRDDIEEAIASGLRRAMKHSDDELSETTIRRLADEVGNHVNGVLAEWLSWSDIEGP